LNRQVAKNAKEIQREKREGEREREILESSSLFFLLSILAYG